MLRDDVLALLRQREGEPLSGEAMSRTLGVSRAAVWKAMETLRQEGYEISSAPRRGYWLEKSPDLLSPGELSRPDRRVGRELVCLDQVDSTNNEIKRRAVGEVPDGLTVVAGEQTGGRGRRGRSFVSPPGKGLYLSALLKPDCPLGEVPALTAWSAVAVCDAIEELCGVRPGIKWPNDVILEGRKLCGILTELELEAETAALRYVVVGIGISARPRPTSGRRWPRWPSPWPRPWAGPPAGRRWPVPCWTAWIGCMPDFPSSGKGGWPATGQTASPWESRSGCSPAPGSGRARPWV